MISLLLKLVYKLHKTPIFEISVIFFFGLLGYFICDSLELSGILSLLVCGIIMGHYAYYNITITSKLSTGITFQTVSNVSEQFLFIYLGLVCMSTKDFDWSLSFIFWEFLILFVSRIANILAITGFFWILYKLLNMTWDLDIFELTILFFGGKFKI
jgi:NhaP-type Na+/H+ or K+/H+ antiporter